MPAPLGALLLVWHTAFAHAPSRCRLFPPSCPRARRCEKCDAQAKAESAALIPHPTVQISCARLQSSWPCPWRPRPRHSMFRRPQRRRWPSASPPSARHATANSLEPPPCARPPPSGRVRAPSSRCRSLASVSLSWRSSVFSRFVVRVALHACRGHATRYYKNRASAASCIEHLWPPMPDACRIRSLSHV
jgi:hypothetical protein